MKIKELVHMLDNGIIPKKQQESYDNCGLIVGTEEKEITGILTTLDVTEEVVLEAERKGCNLIIAHHPIIFFGLKTMVEENSNQKTIMLAIQKGISIYAAHTSLDNRFYNGINKSLAEKIGLVDIAPLKPINPDVLISGQSEMGSGAIGTLKEPKFVIDFLYNLRTKLQINGSIRFSSTNNIAISKIAICTGAGVFMAKEAKKLGADLLITSDITYHQFFDEKGIILADIGHYESEKHASDVIANILIAWAISNNFDPLKINVSKINTNPVSHAI